MITLLIGDSSTFPISPDPKEASRNPCPQAVHRYSGDPKPNRASLIVTVYSNQEREATVDEIGQIAEAATGRAAPIWPIMWTSHMDLYWLLIIIPGQISADQTDMYKLSRTPRGAWGLPRKDSLFGSSLATASA